MVLLTNELPELTLDEKKQLIIPMLSLVQITKYQPATGLLTIHVRIPIDFVLDIPMIRLFFDPAQTWIHNKNTPIAYLSGVLLDTELASWLYKELI